MLTSDLPRLAISIRQPWAHAIVMGWKDIENRSWNTRERGRICIHASAFHKGKLAEDWESYREVVHEHVRASEFSELCQFSPEDLNFGSIIGTAVIVGCTRDHDSPWFFGKYGFVLADQQMLDKPIPVRGALGFFDWRQRLSSPSMPTVDAPAQRSMF